MAKNEISLRDIIREAAGKATDQERQDALKAATEYVNGLPYARPIEGTPKQVQEATYIVAGLLLGKVPYTPEAAALIATVLGDLLEPGFQIVQGPSGVH